MTTINDLSVASSFSPDDKVPMWQNANGVTRGLPLSVLTSAFLTTDQIKLLQISPATETFIAGTNFTPGTSLTLTLANTYGSAVNLTVHFDASYQGPEGYALLGNTLTFTSPIPVGVTKVYVNGGVARLTSAPTDGSVTSASLAPNSVTAPSIAQGAIDGTKLNVSGAGSLTPNIIFAHNPSALTSFTASPGQNFEGISVDVGSYGIRQFGTLPNIVGICGAINIPASATSGANGIGIAGYVKNASPTAGNATNGVAVFGQADCEATNSLIWGANTVSLDNGFQTTVWGAEFDINLTNVNSVAKGVDIVGGSTVEPAVTIGLRIGPLGTFSSPPKRWARGIMIDDGSSITGIEVGAASLNTNSASLPINFFYYDSSNVRRQGGTIISDNSGNMNFGASDSTKLAVFQTGANKQIVVGGGAGLGFYGQTPAGKQTVSGSKGGNAALASLMSALSSIGLFTDSTT